jgi:hypothetical protein
VLQSKEFYLVAFDHDRGEYSIHSVISDERAIKSITQESAKGRKMSCSVSRAAGTAGAKRKAEDVQPGYHFVDDVLRK